MKEKQENPKPKNGEMKKRRVVMADGKRYLIYYTFEGGEMLKKDESNSEVKNDE